MAQLHRGQRTEVRAAPWRIGDVPPENSALFQKTRNKNGTSIKTCPTTDSKFGQKTTKNR
jgi:hypothetical protein